MRTQRCVSAAAGQRLVGYAELDAAACDRGRHLHVLHDVGTAAHT
jgi:hypothetical protein